MQKTELNQSTLIDLVRPIRARWWVIVAIIAIALAASLGLSLSQKKQYSATASFQVQDPTFDLGLLGVGVPATLTSAELASQAAQSLGQPAVVALVKQALHSPLQPYQLSQPVSATVDPNANNVHVTATASTPSGSATLANAFANAAVQVANQNQRRVYANDVAALKRTKRGTVDPLARKELQTLATIASPAQLSQTATPPGAPSSPRPLRSAALAGSLGLLIGLLVVYLWDSVDRRLSSADEVERQFGYPVVGRVREEVLGLSPTADNGGRAVDPIDWEQFRILRHNLDFLGPNGAPRVIAVTSAMPEEGKTTVACFIAFATAAAGKRTLLIECDLRRSVLAKRLGIQVAPGLADFVNGTAHPSAVLQALSFTDPAVRSVNGATRAHAGGSGESEPLFRHQLVCITAGSPTEHPIEVLESGAFRAMLEEVRDAYDVVILDTPPVLPVVDALEVISSTEAIVVCGRAAKLTRDQARGGKHALLRVPEQPICLVVTGITPSRDDYGSAYYNYYYQEKP